MKWTKRTRTIVIRAIQFLSGLGLLSLFVTTAYNFLAGDVKLSFEKPDGRYSKFMLKNDTPVDQLIDKFHISYPTGQPVIGVTTRDVYIGVEGGMGTLPGGNVSWLPIVEFQELDGVVIGSWDSLRFRLPPTTSRDYLELQAAIFDIRYVVRPTNRILQFIDWLLKAISLRNTEEQARYVMVNRHWIPTKSTSLNEALRIACRDDDTLFAGGLCTK